MKKKRIDITGNRYGMLLVDKYVETKKFHAYWLCKCDCGNEKVLKGAALRYGWSKSCGCRFDAISEKGNKYGKLTVIKRIRNENGRGAKWLCECDCGNTTKALGGSLRNGQRKSCGCLHVVNIEKTGLNILYSITERKCKQLKREFCLSKDQFYELIKGDCEYCGSRPSQLIKRQKSKKTQIIYNGIDRVDSLKGYELENCVTCCKYCNRSKSDMGLEDWKKQITKIFNHLKLNE
ncbi:MAG: hypothetical protein ACE5GV_00390 [Candidatus Scalindua sp.]